MKVVAIKPAFYNGARVREGTELEVSDKLKGSWFAKVDSKEAVASRAPKQVRKPPETLSEMAHQPAVSQLDLA